MTTHQRIGGFLNVLILVIAMMAARQVSTAVFVRLGGPDGESLETAAGAASS